MLERIAVGLGIARERLEDDGWRAPARRRARRATGPHTRARARCRRARVQGAGSLVRQAVVLAACSFPATASVCLRGARWLECLQEAGIELLRELLDDLAEHPAQIPAQVIERWGDKPGAESLRSCCTGKKWSPTRSCGHGGIARSTGQARGTVAVQRLKDLSEKSRWSHSGTKNLQEFQRLTEGGAVPAEDAGLNRDLQRLPSLSIQLARFALAPLSSALLPAAHRGNAELPPIAS